MNLKYNFNIRLVNLVDQQATSDISCTECEIIYEADRKNVRKRTMFFSLVLQDFEAFILTTEFHVRLEVT